MARTTAPLGGTAPYWRMVPSGSRTAGPNMISPVVASRRTWRRSGIRRRRSCRPPPSAAIPSPSDTSSSRGAPRSPPGRAPSCMRWPGTPSDSPSISLLTSSAWTASVGAADGERRGGAHGGRHRVERLADFRFGDLAAQPAGLVLPQPGAGVPVRDVQDDLGRSGSDRRCRPRPPRTAASRAT